MRDQAEKTEHPVIWKRDLKQVGYVIVMIWCAIAMGVFAWRSRDATTQDAPTVCRLDGVRAPASGSRWVEIADAEVFDSMIFWEEDFFDVSDGGDDRPPGWYYVALVPAGDPAAAEARRHVEALDVDSPEDFDDEARELIGRVHDATRVFLHVHEDRWDRKLYDMQRAATPARGILRRAPAGLRPGLADRDATDVCILELEERPDSLWVSIVGFMTTWFVFLVLFRSGRRSHLFGPETGELYEAFERFAPFGLCTLYPFQLAVQFLIYMGAAIDHRGRHGRTTLHQAVFSGHSRVIRRLVARGIDIDAGDDRGETALHKAAIFRDVKLTRLLLELGADPTARGKDGLTPAELERVHKSLIKRDDATRREIQEILAAAVADRPAGVTPREDAGLDPGAPGESAPVAPSHRTAPTR